jgi:stearoyl-CoA desaturase (delta-9 desaturase)
MHHAYADTEKDVHSPKYDANWFAMMWRTKIVFSDIFYGRLKPEERFLNGLPEWKTFDKYMNNWFWMILFGLSYVIFYYYFATAWWMWLLIPIHFLMGPTHGTIINWFAHKYGYTNYEVDDTSKNMMPVDVLMLGEGFHNNHHKHSTRPNFGSKWWEFDPVYPFILLFNWVGMIQLPSKQDKKKGPTIAGTLS